jgi:hypothetical protein
LKRDSVPSAKKRRFDDDWPFKRTTIAASCFFVNIEEPGLAKTRTSVTIFKTENKFE